MDLPFFQPMDIDPSGPSGQARRVSFLSSSLMIPHLYCLIFLFLIKSLECITSLQRLFIHYFQRFN